MPQGAGATVVGVGCDALATSALPPHHILVLIPLPLILPATRRCDCRHWRRRPRQPISPAPGRPQGGSPPSLRTRTSRCHRPVPFTTSVASTAKYHKCKSIATSGTTVASVAAIQCVAVPELPQAVFAPTLDAPVVLRSAASFNIHPGDWAGCLQGVSQRPASFT